MDITIVLLDSTQSRQNSLDQMLRGLGEKLGTEHSLWIYPLNMGQQRLGVSSLYIAHQTDLTKSEHIETVGEFLQGETSTKLLIRFTGDPIVQCESNQLFGRSGRNRFPCQMTVLARH